MTWKEHINNTTKKANKTLAFLRRNLVDCPKSVKNNCYKTLIRPILEYGCAVWDPHRAVDIANLEGIHNGAARFATGNYALEHGSAKTNMKDLGWVPLEERRAQIKLKTLFRARIGLINIPLQQLNIPESFKYTTRQAAGSFAIPTSNVDSHLYSFYPNTIRLWNSLPDEGKSLPNVDSFGNYLGKITLRSTYNI